MRQPLETYSAYLDGHCLSDAEVEALRSWIVADENHAIQFVEFAVLHAAITERLRLDRLLDDLASHRSGPGLSPSILASAIREIELNSPRVLEATPPPALALEEELSYSWAAGAAAFVAVAATLLIAAWGIWRSGADVPLPQATPQVAVAVPEAESPKPVVPQVAGRLGTSFDAEWQAGLQPLRDVALDAGTHISLLSGVAQFKMAGGAELVIEGPSQFELTGPDGVKLSRGKASVRIADGGESFIIDTPTLQVVDLGTEFGVETTLSGDAQVMVFDGLVAVAAPEASAAQASTEAPRIEAGYQATINHGPSAISQETLTNPRYFMRPDEVQVRLRALAGSVADQKLAAHYGHQRIAGLLAHQPFDAASQGAKLALGGTKAGLIAQGGMEFARDRQGKGLGIDVQGGAVFMPMDVTGSGPFNRFGLLTDGGRIGRTGSELWISWTMERTSAASDGNDGSAGLSLMLGDRDTVDEPLIIGRASGGASDFIVQSAWGGAAPPYGTIMSEFVNATPGEATFQSVPIDDESHRWLVRIQFQEGSDDVAVWLDKDFDDAMAAAPQAELHDVNIQFDRIRFAVNRGDEVWRFSDLVIADNLAAIEQVSRPKPFHVDE